MKEQDGQAINIFKVKEEQLNKSAVTVSVVVVVMSFNVLRVSVDHPKF